jgi:hypothetical protein
VTKKLAALASFILVLLVQRPHARGSLAQIYFVDIALPDGTILLDQVGLSTGSAFQG